MQYDGSSALNVVVTSCRLPVFEEPTTSRIPRISANAQARLHSPGWLPPCSAVLLSLNCSHVCGHPPSINSRQQADNEAVHDSSRKIGSELWESLSL